MASAAILGTSSPADLLSLGHSLDTSEASFGFLRESSDLVGSPAVLRDRLDQDGYLYLKDFLPQELILDARRSVLERVAAEDPTAFRADRPLLDGVVPTDGSAFTLDAKPTFKGAGGGRRDPDSKGAFRPDVAASDPAIQRVVFGPEIESFYRNLFAEPVRHFDYVWLRMMGPGRGTPSHCDTVYMGRGSRELLTCWIPYGEIPLDVGGLILLEGSHRLAGRLENYLSKDVDSYCTNKPEERQKVAVEGGWSHRGWLTDRPDLLPSKLGGRWLTSKQWGMGDFITFKMTMVHGSLDNASDRVRISSDTRWQPAAHPIDDRWVGEDPPGHSLAGKRGRVC